MTVAAGSTMVAGPYNGNGTQDTYTFTFVITDEDQVTVFETDPSGAVTELTLGVHYTVAGVGSPSGGSATRLAGNLPTGYQWYMRANWPIEQETSFESQGGFYPIVHERAFDYLTRLIMQTEDRALRALRASDSFGGDLSTITELPPPNPLKYLRWNADGTQLENHDINFQITDTHLTVAELISTGNITGVNIVSSGGIAGVDITSSGTIKGNSIRGKEVAVSTSAGVLTCDLSAGTLFSMTASQNITNIAFTNFPATSQDYATVIGILIDNPSTYTFNGTFTASGYTFKLVQDGDAVIKSNGVTNFVITFYPKAGIALVNKNLWS